MDRKRERLPHLTQTGQSSRSHKRYDTHSHDSPAVRRHEVFEGINRKYISLVRLMPRRFGYPVVRAPQPGTV